MRLATPVLLSLTFALTMPAHAGVPSPSLSTVPCLVACPGGDLSFTVIVRDIAGNPVANSAVIIDFSNAPCFVHCNGGGTDYLWTDATRTALRFSDASGAATFSLRGSGSCTSPLVRVLADGVQLAPLAPIASADLNADGNVSALDVAILTAAIGGPAGGYDLQCSGAIDAADVAVVQTHLGDACDLPTPTRSRTWGSLKTIYR